VKYHAYFNFRTGYVDVFTSDGMKYQVTLEIIKMHRLARMDSEGYRGAILLTPEEVAIELVKRIRY